MQKIYLDNDPIYVRTDQSVRCVQQIAQIKQSIVKKLYPGPGKVSPIRDDEYYERVYKPYMRQTVYEMADSIQKEQIQVHLERVQINKQPSSTEYMDTFDYHINIICFGKSLTYLLKYISYFVGDANARIVLYCDAESAHNYRKETVVFQKQSGEETVIPTPSHTLLLKGFHRHLGAVGCINEMKTNEMKTNEMATKENKSAYGLTRNEREQLSRHTILLYSSDHPLMKGIGGKRAVIQYMSAQLAERINDKEFMCMTIDDNITGLYDISDRKSCQVRTGNKACKPDCALLLLPTVYNLLTQDMNRNSSVWFAGVNKGKGAGDNAGESVKGTAAIYKLNLMKPAKLWDAGFMYNPFFTRFFEDVAFNAEIAADGRTWKNFRVHLNFGHFRAPAAAATASAAPAATSITTGANIPSDTLCKGALMDHDDDLPNYLLSHFIPVKGLDPIYSMYFVYAAAVVDAGKCMTTYSVGSLNDANPDAYPSFTFFAQSGVDKTLSLARRSKYAPMNIPFYFFMVLYMWTRPICMQLGGRPPSSRNPFVYKGSVSFPKTAKWDTFSHWIENNGPSESRDLARQWIQRDVLTKVGVMQDNKKNVGERNAGEKSVVPIYEFHAMLNIISNVMDPANNTPVFKQLFELCKWMNDRDRLVINTEPRQKRATSKIILSTLKAVSKLKAGPKTLSVRPVAMKGKAQIKTVKVARSTRVLGRKRK